MNMLQRRSEQVRVFSNKYPLIGPTFWVVSVQYFVTQAVVAMAWAANYSLTQNAISDLGNTVCGEYSGRYVCSPGYTWMNASFVVLGATMIAGSSLVYESFRRSVASAIGFSFMALAGLGTILVGIFPENVNGALHSTGALLAFLLGNIALIIFAYSLNMSRWFRIYTAASGVIGLVSLLLFYMHNYAGLGFGGMERLVAYPQTIWLIAFGLYMSRQRFKASHSS